MQVKLEGEELELAVVAAYGSGQRLDEIEAEFDVTRTFIYWALRKHGKQPNRVQQRRRLTKSESDTVAALYELVTHQDRRIQSLEAENAELRQRLGEGDDRK